MEIDILKETAEYLQMYFQLGKVEYLHAFDELIRNKFSQKDKVPSEVLNEIEQIRKEGKRVDFVNIAYRMYRKLKVPSTFEKGVNRCRAIIESTYRLN